MRTTIIGNVTDDPELRFTPSGAAVANFTVAENRRKFNKATNEWEDNGTTFVRCAIWREAAENVAESVQRGARVVVHGELYTEEFERRDGSKGLSVQMNVEDVGPSLKYATAKVTRTQRRQGNAGGGPAAGDPWATPQAAGAAHDPWAPSAPAEEPPF